jgi:hypothetical protein
MGIAPLNPSYALAAYQAGNRTSDLVNSYFERFGLDRKSVAN